jgi:hypothetical protein
MSAVGSVGALLGLGAKKLMPKPPKVIMPEATTPDPAPVNINSEQTELGKVAKMKKTLLQKGMDKTVVAGEQAPGKGVFKNLLSRFGG